MILLDDFIFENISVIYLLETKICRIANTPYGDQHTKYAMFIENTNRSALWSLFTDRRLTSGDLIDFRNYWKIADSVLRLIYVKY